MADKREALEGITVNGQPLKVFVEEVETQEIEKHMRSEIRDAGAGIGYHGSTGTIQKNTSGVRSQMGNHARKIDSPEVIAHLNYVRHLKESNPKGGLAMNEHLNTGINPEGPIEAALKEYQKKVVFYTMEARRNQAEAERLVQVCNSLNDTLDLLRGKAPVTNSDGRKVGRPGRRDWPGAARAILAGGDGKGLVTLQKIEFKEKLAAHFGLGPTEQTIYQGISSLKQKGVIEEVDGMIGLCG